LDGEGAELQELDATPRRLDALTGCGRPDDPALIVGAEVLTYADLEVRVGALAGWMIGLGLAPGDRVATWLPKTVTACVMPLAAARAGMVHVPVNPALKRGQVAHILGDSGARVLVTQGARAGTLIAADVPVGCEVWEEEKGGLRQAQPSRFWGWDEASDISADIKAVWAEPVEALPSSLCALLYTSGSTGRPKGVMLTNANLWLGAVSVAHYLKLGGEDHTLCVLPLAFDYGQNQLLSTWAAGGCAVAIDYLVPRDVVKAVSKHGITTLAGVPPLWTQLVEADWPETRLKRLTNSGGALTEPLVRKLRGLFPDADLYAMYGLTEAFRSTYLEPALIDAHPTAIGRAIPFAEVLVVRPDGRLCDPDEAGELVHCGPLVAQGYWRDPERTAQRFRPAPASSRYGGIAVWSGDTVVRGRDGLLRFVGRADEMIKTSGNRVSPTEVEEAVTGTGLTDEAVAVGVPDGNLGQSILVVARGEGHAEEEIRMALKRDLPSFMQPARYVWRPALPRNANGKIDRAALKAEVESLLGLGPGLRRDDGVKL
jgi:acyl-CoA ligase (AMP-forming) (exosortase A-associated)